jgi:hypothetical protein
MSNTNAHTLAKLANSHRRRVRKKGDLTRGFWRANRGCIKMSALRRLAKSLMSVLASLLNALAKSVLRLARTVVWWRLTDLTATATILPSVC